MATGRGRLLQQHWLGLQALRLSLRGAGAAPGGGGFRKEPGVRAATFCAPGTQHALGMGPCRGRCPDCSASLDSLPSEILLRILSYLDAATLLCAGCVNWHFYHLANDNSLWVRLYSSTFSPKRRSWGADGAEKAADSVRTLSVGGRAAGHWKREYLMKQMAARTAALARVLERIDPSTGLPVKTKEALRLSDLRWVIALKEEGGKETVLEHVDLCISHSSVTVLWHGKRWPRLASLAALDLCGLSPVVTNRLRPRPAHGPRWRSLVATYSLRRVMDSAMIGCDRLVRIFCLDPGLLVGLWKRDDELAFVMANLHVHQLVERSTLGSAAAPYEPPPSALLSDDRPERGLYGFRLHVDMHGGGASCLCSTFSNLFTSRGHIEDGCAKLVVIHSQDSTEHLPLVGDVGLPWRAEFFEGCMKGCSVLDVTLLDESKKPFWCFSSPVHMRPCPSPADGPHLAGQTSCIDYEDSVGAVHMELVWIEQTQERFVTSLVLRLRLVKINRRFGTQY